MIIRAVTMSVFRFDQSAGNRGNVSSLPSAASTAPPISHGLTSVSRVTEIRQKYTNTAIRQYGRMYRRIRSRIVM